MDNIIKQEITEKYKSGIATTKLAKEYHISHKKIKNILLECGVDIHALDRGFGPKQNKPKGWWDIKEHCEELASTCKNRRELGKKNSAALKSAKKNGWIEEFSEKYFDKQYHFPSIEAKIHLVYVYEFEKTRSAYVGRTTDIKRRDASHRNAKQNDAVYRHSINEGVPIPEPKILVRDINGVESQIEEDNWKNIYQSSGWTILNVAKTGKGSGSLGSIAPIWTYESCKKAALTCNSREEYKKKYSRAHNISRANGWIDEFFPNLMKKKDGCFDTIEGCKEAAKNYSTILQIRKEYPFLYRRISKNKWVEEIREYIGETKETRKEYRNREKHGVYLSFNKFVTTPKNLTFTERNFLNVIRENSPLSIVDNMSTNGCRLIVRDDEKKIVFVLITLVTWSEEAQKYNNNINEKLLDYCKYHGYKTIIVYDSEFIFKEDIITSKIKYFLKKTDDVIRIGARKCEVRESSASEVRDFLWHNHVQGYVPSTIYLGAYYQDKLCAVMAFKCGGLNRKGWELIRFATDNKTICCGIGSKLFSYFIKKYNPESVTTFADRRWGIEDTNVYTYCGFIKDHVTPASYMYFNVSDKGFPVLFNKTNLNKKTLSSKYGFPLTMTETEMTKELGYGRIWDCGLIKYVWKPEDKNEKDKTSNFIERAKSVHVGEKLDYSEVKYINNRTPVKIIDRDLDENGVEYGEYWQSPWNHLKGQSHPRKKGKKISTNKKAKQDKIIERFKEVHKGENLDYSEVEYVNMHTKVKIISHDLRPDGTEYGEFWQEPVVHLKGCTHPEIGKKKQNDSIRYTTEKFIEKAQEVHKDDDYSYDLVDYKTSQEKVCIVCNKIGGDGTPHGKFYIAPDAFIQGKGCPVCGHQLSKGENEIYSYICSLVGEEEVIKNDTSVLNGMEIDVYLPNYKLGFEYDGLRWHGEKFKTDRRYHLKKTLACAEQGISLIHIFEDEYQTNKPLILSKITHMLGLSKATVIGGRKCEIKPVSPRNMEAKELMNKYHIQGYYGYTTAYGAYYNNKLVGIMCFIKEKDCWNLSRFATDTNFSLPGVASRLFNKFIEDIQPKVIKSFLDRRWANGNKPNLYEMLGFKLESILPPDYRYIIGNERVHKFACRKQNLHRKFGLPLTMTETEMAKELGYDRIWDCGLFKYVWTPENKE